jgi:hypothetical protein
VSFRICTFKDQNGPYSIQGGIISSIINQAIIVWTPETKSLLPSLYKREELPLFGKPGVRGDFMNNMSFQLWTP